MITQSSGSLDAPSLIKRCAARSGHQGPVLAMLAAKGGCAWLRATARFP
jgi:hypothetical protein